MEIFSARGRREYIWRKRRIPHLLFCGLLLAGWWLFIPTAHADGGAPNLAYISGTPAGVSVIDVMQRRVSRTLAVTGDPHTILLSFDGKYLYTSQPAQERVSVLEAASGKAHCSAAIPGKPSLLALSPQGEALYTAGNGDTQVRALNPMTCAIEHSFPIAGPVYGLATSLMGGAFPEHIGLYQLWVATTDKLIVLDTDGKQLASFALPAGPAYLCIPPGTVAYATTRQGTVVAVDLATRKVTPPLLANGTFGPMDYNANTGEIYVPDMQHHQVQVLSPLTPGTTNPKGKISRTISLDGIPTTVAITNDGQLGFIALEDGRVVMLDIPGRQIVTTIRVEGQPHFIITGLYPPTPAASPPVQQPVGPTRPAWQTGLLIVFLIAFFLALLGLVIILVRWWRSKQKA
ncbi:YncE family protein [Ktedonosporobacter rubrisoli]|uniref:YncE family protein n=1 Tax=Ktedonosporobacter rubrisoli TaxID=2509675 RepID=A0A4P6JSM7_KTERU|nr:YncE family protein [Ktedonosporobacter rubrisoli]QBD78547.1 YncE family protein [Ktedonosporobacter rubrisoli]